MQNHIFQSVVSCASSSDPFSCACAPWLLIWHTYLAHLAPITVSPILHPLSMASPLTSCYRNSLLICCFKFSVMNSLVICGAPTLTLFCMCQSDALFVQSAIISFFLYSCGQVLTLLEFFFFMLRNIDFCHIILSSPYAGMIAA